MNPICIPAVVVETSTLIVELPGLFHRRFERFGLDDRASPTSIALTANIAIWDFLEKKAKRVSRSLWLMFWGCELACCAAIFIIFYGGFR